MSNFWSFFGTTLWQGFLRPIDMRIEVEKLDSGLQARVVICQKCFSKSNSRMTNSSKSVWAMVSPDAEPDNGLLLYEFYNRFHNGSPWTSSGKLNLFSRNVYTFRLVWGSEWIGSTISRTYGHWANAGYTWRELLLSTELVSNSLNSIRENILDKIVYWLNRTDVLPSNLWWRSS